MIRTSRTNTTMMTQFKLFPKEFLWRNFCTMSSLGKDRSCLHEIVPVSPLNHWFCASTSCFSPLSWKMFKLLPITITSWIGSLLSATHSFKMPFSTGKRLFSHTNRPLTQTFWSPWWYMLIHRTHWRLCVKQRNLSTAATKTLKNFWWNSTEEARRCAWPKRPNKKRCKKLSRRKKR